ncbi:MAG: hypothetical protein AAF636_15605 [Pseudomonadota bacterium]
MTPPQRKFGPTKGELQFRVGLSGSGLLALVAAVLYRGWPAGFAMIEVITIGALFFGGTLFFSLRKLLRGDYPEN